MENITSENENELLESDEERNGSVEIPEEELSGFSDTDTEDKTEEIKPKKKLFGYDKQDKKFFVGKFKVGKKVVAIILAAAVLAGACSGVVVKIKSKNAAKNMYTDTAVERRSIKNTITGSSSVEPNDSYNVMTIKSGDIVEDYFKEGDVVSKGDKLYQFDDDDAQKSLTSAENSLTKAQQSYVDAVKQRTQTISSNKIGLQSAQNSVTKALNSLNETKNNQYIKADITGKIGEITVKEGDRVNSNMSVATIYDDSSLKIKVPFNDYDAESVWVGASAEVSVIGSGDKMYGTVTEKSSSSVSTQSHAKVVYVTVEVSNPGALTNSDYGSVEVNDVACADTAQFEYVNEGSAISLASGTLSSLDISEGDKVYAGQQIGYVKYDNDNTLKNAQLSYNDAVLSLEKQVLQNDTFSQDSSVKNAQLSLDDARLSLEKAQDAVEDYLIEAPIDGTVVTKNSKAGDTIDSQNGSDPLCVIYDLSCVKFSIDVDETEIALVQTGQKATVTADAVDGQFEGVVTKVPVDGVNQNGVTTYTIELQIDEYGDLLPGMNIDAEIVVEEAENVIAVPVNSVNRGNIIFVKDDGKKHENDVTEIIKSGKEKAEKMAEEMTKKMKNDDSDKGNKDKNENDTKEKSDREENNLDNKAENNDMPPMNSNDKPIVSGEGIREISPDGDDKVLHKDMLNGSDMPEMTDKSDMMSDIPMNLEIPDGYLAIKVETGINDTEYIEIKSGISEGDLVRTINTQSSSENASFGAEGMMPGMNGMSGGMGGGMPGGMGGGMSGGMGGGMSRGGGMPGGR